MKSKICVVTGTRAEYGLLKPVIKKINSDNMLQLRLVVTGMHLSPEFGATYTEIERDGYLIDEKIDILLSGDSNYAMSKSIGVAIISFTDYFARTNPDIIIILGDRYEIFAVATAAAMSQIPIAHLYGGDTTEGAMDEFLRHSISKMSYLHFTSTEDAKRRVEQLGENPERVFCVGATGVENILNVPLLDKVDLEKSLDFRLQEQYAVVTFHPVTMENQTATHQLEELFAALDKYRDMNFIFTKANSDANGRVINQMIDQHVENRSNMVAFTSLGMLRYLSALKYATLVIGNSSSGIYEAPSFKIPTINIGDRQKGRIQSISIINCKPIKKNILQAIDYGLSEEFRNKLFDSVNPYEGNHPTKDIVEIIVDFLEKDKINLKKTFYDIL